MKLSLVLVEVFVFSALLQKVESLQRCEQFLQQKEDQSSDKIASPLRKGEYPW